MRDVDRSCCRAGQWRAPTGRRTLSFSRCRSLGSGVRQVAALLAELRAEQARLRGEFVRQAAAVHALQAAVAGAHGYAPHPAVLRLTYSQRACGGYLWLALMGVPRTRCHWPVPDPC